MCSQGVGSMGGWCGGTNSHTGIVWSSHESKKHKLQVQPCPEGLRDTSPALRSISSQFLLFGGLSSPHCFSHDFMGSGNSLQKSRPIISLSLAKHMNITVVISWCDSVVGFPKSCIHIAILHNDMNGIIASDLQLIIIIILVCNSITYI